MSMLFISTPGEELRNHELFFNIGGHYIIKVEKHYLEACKNKHKNYKVLISYCMK